MAHRRNSLELAIAIFACFFISGLSGLIYEVIWTRLLLTMFGASIYAVSTVLAAFMGGLALGSFLGGKLADRWSRLLLVYGILEICIALAALAVPTLQHASEPIYQALYQTNSASYLSLSLLRFFLTFLTLLIPTTCMGATLPLLARFLVLQSGTVGSRIGGLYAINTLGAVTGTFLAGFVLIAEFGIRQTTWIAATLSVIAGLVALILSWRFETSARGTAPVPDERASAWQPSGRQLPVGFTRFLFVTYGISGFVALGYQVFWTRTLVFQFMYLGNTTYAFSTMLTVFLIGLAAGSSLMSALVDRQRNPVSLYGILQVLTGLAGVFSLYLLSNDLFGVGRLSTAVAQANPSWFKVVASAFLGTAITIGPATFLMGMAFPVVARLCVAHRVSVGTVIGRLYAVNTIGAILGSFAAGFVMIPFLGLSRGLLVLGLLNVINGTFVLLLNPNQSRSSRRAWGGVSLALVSGLWITLQGDYRFLPVYSRLMPKFVSSIVEYREGPLATVTVADDAYGQRRIFVDGVFVAGTDLSFLTDQKSLAHIPMLLLEDPQSALTVGFGSGGASYSFLLYDEMKRLDCVEICETVPQMAHTLKQSNHGVLDEWTGGTFAGQKFHDGRFQILLDDVRTYLRFTDTKYDVIATDCTDLRYKSNASLYDVEYFALCKKRLTDNGMVVVWFPLTQLDEELFACAMKTFARVFPQMTIWHMQNVPTHYLLLLGTKEDQPLRVNLERLRERISRPEIRKDLEEVWLHQPEKLLSSYSWSAPNMIGDWDAVTARLNTEDSPYIEFEAPKTFVPSLELYSHLNRLYRRRSSIASLIEDPDQYPEFMERLKGFEEAIPKILQGHFHYRTPNLLAARDSYRQALRICPEDESIEVLLQFPELRRIVEYDKEDIAAMGSLAVVEWLDGNIGKAQSLFRQVVRETDQSPAPSGEQPERFQTLTQSLETCFRSSKNPVFLILHKGLEQRLRSNLRPGRTK